MRAARTIAGLFAAGALALVMTPGCQEPTQVTVDVRLVDARCDEIHGTAITVGVQPADTEERIRSRFPTGQTTDCDPATRRIGTLVVTPSDDERAAIVVVAAYGARHDPTECQPPDYAGCIVARRRFSFSKHRRLTMPITIDPECANVPCDAFSTCRKGRCFDSEIAPCDGAECEGSEPGSLKDGGIDLDAAVVSDGGPVVNNASCEGTLLRCGDVPCPAPGRCCIVQGSAVCDPSGSACPGAQACCTSADCGGRGCKQPNGVLTNIPDAGGDFDGGGDAGAPSPDAGGPGVDAGGTDGGAQPDGGTSSDAGSDASTPPPPGLGVCLAP